MASVSWRKNEMLQAVGSLYDQVDEIHLYLSNYSEIPKELIKKKINIYRSQDHGGTGAEGKFFKVKNGYYFSADDDIIYPKDYVKKTIETIEKYNRKYVVAYHGSTIHPNLRSYYSDKKTHRFVKEKEYDSFIHIPGSGVMAFHTDTLKLNYEDFKIPNMVDITAGLVCQDQGVGIVCPARIENWIKPSPISDQTKSIYETYLRNDKLQTKTVNNVDWKIHAPACKKCFRLIDNLGNPI